MAGYQPQRQPLSLNQATVNKHILPSRTYRTWLVIYLFNLQVASKLKYVTPQQFKNIYHSLRALSNIYFDGLSTPLMTEFSQWLGKRANNSLDIINFGVISYDWRHQRPQQLAKTLGSRGHRVFYVDNEFHYSPHASLAKLQVIKKAPNVYVVRLSAPRYYFIYQDKLSEQGIKIMLASLKKLFRHAQILNPVIKVDHPFWQPLVSSLNVPVVYDAMDLHQGFALTHKDIAPRELELVRSADLVLASSPYIAKSLRLKPTRSLLVRNAAEISHFRPSSTRVARPQDLSALPGRIIGYYGALAEWLDLKLVEAVARAYPADSVVLIGRVQNQGLARLAARYPNLHLLGERPYDELPKYLRHFDVALIPFRLTPLILATDPVKVYEYLAAGKPVVATRIPDLARFKSHLYIASSPQDFAAKVGRGLDESSARLAMARQKAVQGETWDARVDTLLARLTPLVFPKVSVVILTYNHAHLSQVSIDSVLKRSKYGNLEVVIVDNNSDAETVKMLSQYKGKQGIKLKLNQVNHGFAKGNNIGMRLATGDYIILLNNDVRVTPGWIERLLSRARRDKRVGLVGPVTNSIGNESKINIAYDPENVSGLETAAADYTYAHWGESLSLRNIAAFAWLMPRSVYAKLGGLDERFGRGLFEDDDYCMRVKRARLTILLAEDSFVHHYGGASTNWGSPEYQQLFNTNKAKFEQKWKSKWIPHQHRPGVK